MVPAGSPLPWGERSGQMGYAIAKGSKLNSAIRPTTNIPVHGEMTIHPWSHGLGILSERGFLTNTSPENHQPTRHTPTRLHIPRPIHPITTVEYVRSVGCNWSFLATPRGRPLFAPRPSNYMPENLRELLIGVTENGTHRDPEKTLNLRLQR